jgi:hypothetical protein
MPPGPEQAREIARELCASARAWGQRLFACVARLQLDQSLARWFRSPPPSASVKALPASTGRALRLATPGSRD